jgi:hypothetical protein
VGRQAGRQIHVNSALYFQSIQRTHKDKVNLSSLQIPENSTCIETCYGLPFVTKRLLSKGKEETYKI